MRVAVTKATLQVPPTYFAVQHAMALRSRYDFGFFGSAMNVIDRAVADVLPLHDASTRLWFLRDQSFAIRRRVAPALEMATAGAIERWKPDVIHQHAANASGAAIRAQRRTGTPLIVTVHGADAFLPLTERSTVRWQKRALLEHHKRTVASAFATARSILAVSEYIAGRAVAAGADPKRVQVHYQGIDTDVYTPTSSSRSLVGVPRVVFVGTLSESKGVRDLLQASLRLNPSVSHELIFAGDGPLRSLLEAAAKDHHNVKVLGPIDRSAVRELLDGSALLVLPTKLWEGRREAAGLVTLEAQAMMVPVVVYDSGGAAEMLRDGDTGYLVTEGDIDGLTERMRQVLSLSPNQHAAMGDRARRFVIAERSLAASASRLAELYEEITG